MFDETDKYKTNGHFFFNPGDILSEASAKVPNEPGVFIIYRLAKGNIDLVYIGQSGFHSSPLQDSINNRGGTGMQELFEKKMPEENIDGLDIYWWVTVDGNHQDTPDYVKGLLIQRYYSIYEELPPWNREF